MQDLRKQFEIIHNIKKPKDECIDKSFETYLEENIVTLWPSGWMKLESIKKECYKDLVQKPKENKKPSTVIPPSICNVMPKERKSSTVNNNSVVKSTTDVSKISPPTITSSASKVQLKTEKTENTFKTAASTVPNVLSSYQNTLPLITGDLIDGCNRFGKLDDSKYISKHNATTNGINEHSSPTKRSSDHSINHIMSPSTANSIEIASRREEDVVVISDSSIANRDNSDDDCLIIEDTPHKKQAVDAAKYKIKKENLTTTRIKQNERELSADDEEIRNVTSTMRELEVSEKPLEFFIIFFYLIYFQFSFSVDSY